MRPPLWTLLALLTLLSPPLQAQDPDEIPEGLPAFFDALLESVREGDSPAALELLDLDRMWEQVLATPGSPEFTPAMQRTIRAGFELGLRMDPESSFPFEAWERHEILKVERLAEGREALVVVRHRDADGYLQKSRWWLVRSGDGWRYFDFEDIDTSLRQSALVSRMLGALLDTGNIAWISDFDALLDAADALYEEDWDGAREISERVRDTEFPPVFEAVRQMLLASLELGELHAGAALGHVSNARSLNPDMPVLDYIAAAAHLLLEEFSEALRYARAYLAVLGGDDPDGRELETRALLGLGRRKEAVEAARIGLEVSPDHFDLLVALGRALPADDQGELAERFATLPEPADWFEDLVLELRQHQELPAMRALIAKLREIDPEDTNADYYEADVLAMEDRWAEAAEVLEKILDRAPEEEREVYEEAYLLDMVYAEKALEGYLRFRGSRTAFTIVADELVDYRNGAALLAVVEEHAKLDPDAPWLGWYHGEALNYEERFEEAEEAFAAAAEKAEDDDIREMIRDSRVYNLYLLDQGLEAYERLGPRRRTFKQLAWFYADEGDDEKLIMLVGLHEKADPEDPALPLYEAEFHYLREEWEKCVEILLKERNHIFSNPDHIAHFEDRVIRGLIGLKRFDEALTEARLSTLRDDNPWYEALVHAAAGRPAELSPVLDALLAAGITPEVIYGDEILGAALRSAPFEQLRKRVPPPEK